MNEERRYFVAVTGASGALYAKTLVDRLLEAEPGCELLLSITENGAVVIADELGVELNLQKPKLHRLFMRPDRLTYYHYLDVAAPPASGTYPVDAMIIVPCSTNTMAKLASGIADSLITRAADVMLKEHKRLIVVPRETPLSTLQLRNMLRLAEAGAVVLPAMPALYFSPASINDLADFIATKICDQLGIELGLDTRWWQEEED